jgi:hypothetical protein
MSTTRRQRPFADGVYEDDDPERLVSAEPIQHGADDRTYIILMYQEHARQARQQELMRALWAALTLALVVLLAVVSTMPGQQGSSGILICGVAAMGAISLGKFRERYVLHLAMMRGFRTILGETVRADIARTSHVVGKAHQRKFRLRGFVSLQAVWMLGCIAAFGVGVEMVWQAGGVPLTMPQQSPPARQVGPEAKPVLPLAPGPLPPGEGLP